MEMPAKPTLKGPADLEIRLRYLSSWTNLKALIFVFCEESNSVNDSFLEMGIKDFEPIIDTTRKRLAYSDTPDAGQILYGDYIRTLKEAGGSNGYLSHLRTRRFEVCPKHPNVTFPLPGRNNCPYVWRFIAAMSSPEALFRELSESFQADLIVYDEPCYTNGVRVKPATSRVGPVDPECVVLKALQIPFEDVESSLAFQFENELSHLFLVLLAMDISNMPLPVAELMVRRQKPLPAFPQIQGTNKPCERKLWVCFSFIKECLKREIAGFMINEDLKVDLKHLEKVYRYTLTGVTMPSTDDDFDGEPHKSESESDSDSEDDGVSDGEDGLD
jgi:hypothetical protein